MSWKSKIVAAALAAVVGVGTLAPNASAGDYGRYYSGNSYGYHHGYRHSYRPYYGAYAYNPYYDYERERRRKRRNDVAKAVAVGVGIAILGAALSHNRRWR